jgi:hypothetical protein
MMNEELLLVMKRLEKHPHIVARMVAMLDIAENTSENVELAKDAEYMVVKEISKMGNEILTTWAKCQEIKKSKNYTKGARAIKHGKKKLIG